MNTLHILNLVTSSSFTQTNGIKSTFVNHKFKFVTEISCYLVLVQNIKSAVVYITFFLFCYFLGKLYCTITVIYPCKCQDVIWGIDNNKSIYFYL